MRQFNIVRDTRGFLKAAENHLRFKYMITQAAQKRAKILTFWQQHGLTATKDAFGISRATLFRWQKSIVESKGNLISLEPRSRKPHRFRSSKLIHQSGIESFVLDLRRRHPRLGKDKIKPLLDEYCREQALKFLSSSTIGFLIKKLKERKLLASSAVSYGGLTGRIFAKREIKRKKSRLAKGYKATSPGELLQLDTVIQHPDGCHRYLISAIDTTSKFAFSYGYSHVSSATATDFMKKLKQVAPFPIKQIQTDNGSEFAKYFASYLKDESIKQFHTYPKTPKMNAYIERYNRTIQYEFANYERTDWLHHLERFNHKLMDWLIWYNTRRVHHSLGLKAPMQYLVEKLQLTPAESHMYVTHTKP